MQRITSFPFHPILWALFPPLALLGNNISQVPPGDAVRTLLVSEAIAIFLWVFLRLVLRSWHRAALVVSGFMILFFTYGHVYHLIEYQSLFGINLGRHRVLLLVFGLVLAGIILLAIRIKDELRMTTALNLIGAVALVFPVYQILSFELKTSSAAASPPSQSIQAEVADLQVPDGTTAPDIYYIILDTYTRQDILKSVFSYDNSAFLKNLQDQGFYIAGCSQSNYNYTDASLVSSLNFNLLQSISSQLTPSNKNNSDLYPYLTNNAAVYTLHNLGYRFMAFESGYSPTEFTNADEYYSQQSDWLGILLQDGLNPFEVMQLDTSAGMFVYELSSHLPASVQKFLSLDTAYVIHRNRILYTLNRLERMASVSGPKFVFVHILAPHNPFVFGPNGEYVERKTPFTLNDDRDVIELKDYVAGYNGQVTFLNSRILEIVQSLIHNSAVPPIIILQGDHGVPRLTGSNDTILNAYYLPAGGAQQLYQTISPVNTFRVIFNQYFGGHLPMLADTACTTNAASNPFGCTPVPDPDIACRPNP